MLRQVFKQVSKSGYGHQIVGPQILSKRPEPKKKFLWRSKNNDVSSTNNFVVTYNSINSSGFSTNIF